MAKKVQYHNMLKQALSEWDTTKTVDVKGPMLDGILSYDGADALTTHKDAASILERYYFNENRDKGVEVNEAEANDDGLPASGDSMKHTEGEGTEQAGTSDASSFDAMEKEIEKEITAEMKALTEQDDEKKEEKSEEKKDEKPEDKEDAKELEEWIKLLEQEDHDEKKETPEDEKKESKETQEKEKEEGKEEHEVETENAIIERLIQEMEEENKTTASMEDTKGAGTEQAGTGDAAKEIPDRKDDHMDDVERPKLEELMKILEQDDAATDLASDKAKDVEPAGGDAKDEDSEGKPLDVDKVIAKEDAGVGGGPLPKAKEAQAEEEDTLEEAFKLFEAMDEEEKDEKKEDKPEDKKDEKDEKVEKEDPKNLRV